MRQALNNNPVVQIAVVGVLVVVVGLFFMMNMKKKSPPHPASTAASGTSASASTPGTTSPVTVGGSSSSASAPTTPSAPAAMPSLSTGTVTPSALVPGRGLPRDVVAAWKRGDAIVLLIARRAGIDDRMVRSSVESLSGDSHVAVFVTRAKNVARYSRITQGVGVDQVPALVVVRPRSDSGPVPEAQVSYGFRDSQSVVQAVHDALYKGPDDLPYSPR
jgi:hypothetical protein